MKSLQFVILAIILSWFGLFNIAGCPGNKAVDTTQMIHDLTAGEQVAQQGKIPGSLIGEEGTIVFPTVPGKNIKFTVYYPDGKPKVVFESLRDPVVAALASAAVGSDAQKFAADAEQRAWTRELIGMLIEQAQMFRAQSLAGAAASVPADPSLKQAIADALKAQLTNPETLDGLAKALKAKTGG